MAALPLQTFSIPSAPSSVSRPEIIISSAPSNPVRATASLPTNPQSQESLPVTKPLFQRCRDRIWKFAILYSWQIGGVIITGIALLYAERAYRLAIWTAKKDFRETCISDIARGFPYISQACLAENSTSLSPAPFEKRDVIDPNVAQGYSFVKFLQKISKLLGTLAVHRVLSWLLLSNLKKGQLPRFRSIYDQKELPQYSRSSILASRLPQLLSAPGILLLVISYILLLEFTRPLYNMGFGMVPFSQKTEELSHRDLQSEPLGIGIQDILDGLATIPSFPDPLLFSTFRNSKLKRRIARGH